MTQTLKHPLAIAQLCKSWQIKVFNHIESDLKKKAFAFFRQCIDQWSDVTIARFIRSAKVSISNILYNLAY